VFPRFRTRQFLPIADLAFINHVVIGKTNIISYPYSSEVNKALIGDEQYKFVPEKVAKKYTEFLENYKTENLKAHQFIFPKTKPLNN